MTDLLPFQSFARRLRDTISCASNQPESLGKNEFRPLALELFRLQYDHIAPYRSLCDRRRKTPATVTDWIDIPALPTSAFKDLELSSLPISERTTVFHSSGTTEQRPSRHFHSAESLSVYEASLLPWFQRHVVPESQANLRWIALTPPPTACPHSSLIHMFEAVQKAFAPGETQFYGELSTDNTWEIRFSEVFATLEQAIASQQPVILLGTAFLFVHLLDELEERGITYQLPPGSRLMETGGYKGRSRELPKAELHRLLSQRLGLPDSAILCEYGMSELSSQAYDRTCFDASPRRFQFPPWVHIVIVSPETGAEVAFGEPGLVRIHDLANIWSIAAVQTEDLAIRHEAGFELLGRAAKAEPRGCSLMAG